ncbi:MAG: hypothetical protein K5663_10105 [Clostridiales bacterium]|nr:hypothetical protein [Clostridiales bacterium]
MRCACPNCGTYMVHSESLTLGCVCPQCASRCKMCLGTDSVVSREDLKQIASRMAYISQITEENEDRRLLDEDAPERETDEYGD